MNDNILIVSQNRNSIFFKFCKNKYFIKFFNFKYSLIKLEKKIITS